MHSLSNVVLSSLVVIKRKSLSLSEAAGLNQIWIIKGGIFALILRSLRVTVNDGSSIDSIIMAPTAKEGFDYFSAGLGKVRLDSWYFMCI